MSVKVLLADDQSLVRSGFRMVLESEEDIEVVGEAANANQAIFLDATIVRMVLVPAVMQLLRDRNWWIPSWLERRLPSLEIEPPVGTPATSEMRLNP